MNSTPAISVIMPVFNEERYLRKSIESFLSQTISDQCELICIDDGSSDSSLQILESYQAYRSASIIVLQQPNLGSGVARNRGLDAASGEYVAFLDADDEYPGNDVLETLLRAAEDNGVAVAGGSMEIAERGRRFRYCPAGLYREGQVFECDGLMSYEDYQFEYGYQRFLYKKSVLDENGVRFPRYLRYQDPPFFVRAMIAAGRFYALEKLTYTYRELARQVNWSVQKTVDLIDGITDVARIAADHGYNRLFDASVHRLCVEFDPVVSQALEQTHDFRIIERLALARVELRELNARLGGSAKAALVDAPSAFSDFACAEEAASLRKLVEEQGAELARLGAIREGNEREILELRALVLGGACADVEAALAE